MGLIQAFVNTADLEPGIDALGDPDALSGWLVARRLMAAGARASEQDLKHSIAVREAIRGAIGANSGGSVYPVDMATLNRCSKWRAVCACLLAGSATIERKTMSRSLPWKVALSPHAMR